MVKTTISTNKFAVEDCSSQAEAIIERVRTSGVHADIHIEGLLDVHDAFIDTIDTARPLNVKYRNLTIPVLYINIL